MSESRPATSTDVFSDALVSKRPALFRSRFFGKDRQDITDEPAALETPISGEPELSAGSTMQTPLATAAQAERSADLSPVSAPRAIPPLNQRPPVSMISLDQRSTNPRHALAQLTFSFGIASLQLTPSFQLGSLELKALSNVVSLRLVTAQTPENPLEAATSFQIDRVELDGAQIRSLLLKPLGEIRQLSAPSPYLRVNDVMVAGSDAPITVTAADQAAAVQISGTFAVACLVFTPSFEIESLRLEPSSHAALLRIVPSNGPAALDLPPALDFAQVRLSGDGQISSVRLVPSAAPPA